MSTPWFGSEPRLRSTFYTASITHKAAVALSGLGLCVWTLLHAAGISSVFAGPQAMNGYAEALRRTPLPWLERIGFVVLLSTHAALTIRLWRRAQRARAVRYRSSAPLSSNSASSFAARSMRWSGATLGAWVVYHVLHIYGPAHHDYIEGDVHHNLVSGLESPLVAGSYGVATLLLMLHLWHGLKSSATTLGLAPGSKRLALGVGSLMLALICGGLLAPVLAALAGYWSNG